MEIAHEEDLRSDSRTLEAAKSQSEQKKWPDLFLPVSSVPPPRDHTLFVDPWVRLSYFAVECEDHTIHVYPFPEGGWVEHHVSAVKSEHGHKLLDTLLTSDLPLRRHEVLCGLESSVLSNHFSCNYGAPYTHSVALDDHPMDTAPAVIREVMVALEDATGGAEFNEVLINAYEDGQAIGYHSDGEDGLGPVVGGVSLGGTATMCFRRKVPKIHGRKGRGGALSIGLSLQCNPSLPGKKALALVLNHGDVVVMSGMEVQRWYKHCVKPPKCAPRLNATARYINHEDNTPRCGDRALIANAVAHAVRGRHPRLEAIELESPCEETPPPEAEGMDEVGCPGPHTECGEHSDGECGDSVLGDMVEGGTWTEFPADVHTGSRITASQDEQL